MRSNKKKMFLLILILAVLSVLILSRCTPNQSEPLAIDTPTSSPAVTPTTEEATPTASPEVTPPAASNTPSPTAKPSVKPSAIATKTASPTPRKSVKPTSSPREVTEPDTTVRTDANGDGLPDYIKPTVTFTNITCEVLEDKYIYRYEINFSGGDNYSFNNGGGARGFQMRLENGKLWFSYPEITDGLYKMRSNEDRSWTFIEKMSLTKKTWSSAVESGAKGVRSPFYVYDDSTGDKEPFQPPNIDYALCRR